MTRPFASGDRILIAQEGRGAAIGKIEDIRAPEEFTAWHPAAEISRDWHITRTAVISYYQASGNQLMFVAVEIGGEWWDLQQQPLTIRHYGTT